MRKKLDYSGEVVKPKTATAQTDQSECESIRKAETISTLFNKKEKLHVIEIVEVLCSFSWVSPGSSRCTGSGIRINSYGSGTGLWV
jgi:hypothetical protein